MQMVGIMTGLQENIITITDTQLINIQMVFVHTRQEPTQEPTSEPTPSPEAIPVQEEQQETDNNGDFAKGLALLVAGGGGVYSYKKIKNNKNKKEE